MRLFLAPIGISIILRLLYDWVPSTMHACIPSALPAVASTITAESIATLSERMAHTSANPALSEMTSGFIDMSREATGAIEESGHMYISPR